MKTIRFTPTATAGMIRASKDDRADFIAMIEAFADDPAVFEGSDVVKPLTGWPNHFIVKVGVFRAILRDERNQVTVTTVRHRGDAYKGKRG